MRTIEEIDYEISKLKVERLAVLIYEASADPETPDHNL